MFRVIARQAPLGLLHQPLEPLVLVGARGAVLVGGPLHPLLGGEEDGARLGQNQHRRRVPASLHINYLILPKSNQL